MMYCFDNEQLAYICEKDYDFFDWIFCPIIFISFSLLFEASCVFDKLIQYYKVPRNEYYVDYNLVQPLVDQNNTKVASLVTLWS